jgi:hypothetical protein
MRYLIAAILLPALCAAAEPSQVELEVRTMSAVRTDTPPIIDGDLSDAAWAEAAVADEFIDTILDQPVNLKTVAKVIHDDEFIYVSFECWQDPDTLIASVRKYDRFQLRREDYVQVAFDTFRDKTSAYVFLVSPLGTRWDASDGVYGRNESWDAEWPAAAKILEDRYVVEMAIPVGVMHLNRKEDQTWGINFRRKATEANEYGHWNYNVEAGVPRWVSGPKFIADFGELHDLDLSNAVIQRRPQLETYISMTATEEKNHVEEETDYGTRSYYDRESDFDISAGLDLSMRLSPHWVATLTLNPDFGQVEADAATIELRDTERFLDERRPFFREGAELFETPINIYHSRRITDINSGAKMTGGGKTWSAGLIAVDGGSAQSDDAYFLVGRYTHRVNADTQLGAMWVSANREDDGYNFVGGLDARVNLSPSTVWTTQLLGSQEKYSTLIYHDDYYVEEETFHMKEHAFSTAIEGGTKPFFWELTYEDISESFDPELGFIPRTDIVGPTLMLEYRQDFDNSFFEERVIEAEFQYYQNHDGQTTLRDFSVEVGVDMRNNIDVFVWHNNDYHAPYDNHTTGIWVAHNLQDKYRSLQLAYFAGEFEDVKFHEIELEKPWRFTDRWTNEFVLNYRREFPDDTEREDVWLWRLESEYTFAWQGRLKLTVEEGSDDTYNRTLLFAYEDVGKWDYYLVISDAATDDGDSIVRGAFTKFVYRW